MSFGSLSTGTKVLFISGLLLLIDSFFNWQQVEIAGINTSAGVTMWHGIGVLAGLLLIALLLWEGAHVAGALKGIELPVSAALITVALAGATALFTIIKFLVANEFRHWPAWVGLILAILVGVGGWLRYSETPSQAQTPAPTTPPPA
jgi:hypothetical protein